MKEEEQEKQGGEADEVEEKVQEGTGDRGLICNCSPIVVFEEEDDEKNDVSNCK